MSNEIITLVKDTSLARVIAVYEIIWNGQKFIKTDGIIWPLLYTGVFYLVFNGHSDAAVPFHREETLILCMIGESIWHYWK
jgi:ABC-type amino acid transport system permease subunit